MRPSVYIMMSAFNGAKYIGEQIESILNQKHTDVTLVIRDDGSTDETPDIISDYAAKHDNISVIRGDNVGFAKSFWSLLLTAPEGFDYYAFSDQDDVWKPNKMAAAIHVLKQSDRPLRLYASALTVTDDKLNVQYKNDFPKLRVGLGSALTRPRLSGCTMAFSPELLRLCKAVDIREVSDFNISHDVLVYLACLSCGGRVLYSRKSYILLRRHTGTVTGHGKGVIKRAFSVLDIFTNRRHEAEKQAAFIRGALGERLTAESAEYLDTVSRYADSFLMTLSFCLDKRNKCGLMSVDLVNIFAILFRYY